MREKKKITTSEYLRIHTWLKKNYGTPQKCESLVCGGACKVFHWALKKGKEYEKNREHFKRFCASCHRKYDYKFNNYGMVDRAKRSTITVDKNTRRDIKFVAAMKEMKEGELITSLFTSVFTPDTIRQMEDSIV